MIGWLLRLFGLGEPMPCFARSPDWPRVRKAHLGEHPACEGCGTQNDLEVHHLHPVFAFPDLELDPSNLVTLCGDGARGCHFRLGHCFSWFAWNIHVLDDCQLQRQRIATRRVKKEAA